MTRLPELESVLTLDVWVSKPTSVQALRRGTINGDNELVC